MNPERFLALKKPCHNCPFLKEGGISLRQGRIEGIIKDLLSDDMRHFQCHKTTSSTGGRFVEEFDDDGNPTGDMAYAPSGNESFCYGAMTYLLKAQRPNVLMRLGSRIGLLDLDAMQSQFDKIIEVKE